MSALTLTTDQVDQFDAAYEIIEEAIAIQEMAFRTQIWAAEDAAMLKRVSHRTFLMLEQAKTMLGLARGD